MRLNNKTIITLFPYTVFLPLVDMFLFEKPIFTMVSYIIIIITLVILFLLSGNRLKFSISEIVALMFVVLMIISGVINIFTDEYMTIIYSLFCIVAVSLVSAKIVCETDQYTAISRFTLFYAITIVLIYAYRAYIYNFDFYRVRGNVSIYGGNSAHLVFLFLLLIFKRYIPKYYKYLLIFTVVHAIMFISRGAIIITLLWVLYELIKNIKPKRFLKNLFIVAIFTLMIYVLLNNTSFGNILYLRFSQIFVSISEGGSWLGSRNDIIDYTVGFLQENPENVIFGIGPTMFRYIHPLGYSNTHNLLLDVFVEFGILTFIIFCIMILVMIYNSKNWFLVILTFIYAIFEGVNLLYNNGVIVTGYVLFVFLVTYLKIVRSKRTSRINLS